jgi:hypothetical protein
VLGKGRFALRLGAIAIDELRQRHTVLELDSIHGHRWLPSNDSGQLMRPVAHGMSLAEVHD